MNRFFRYGFFLALLACAGLAVWAVSLRATNRGLAAKRPPMPAVAPGSSPLAVPIVDTYTDASGAHHTVFDATVNAEIKRRSGALAAPIAAKIDSAARAAGIRPRELDGYSTVQLEIARDSVRFQKRVIDSLGRSTRYYQGKYLSFVARDGVPGDTSDYGYFDYRYNLDLTTLDYSRRDKLAGLRIGPRRYFTDISSPDTAVRIRGAEKLTLERRQPAVGFRVQALVTYGFRVTDSALFAQGTGFAAGLGTRFDFGNRLNVGVNYLYSPESGQARGTIYGKYDIWQAGR